jgi:hypothetical protein
MKPQSRTILFTFITLFVFVFSLFAPIAVFADDGAPPDAAPTEAPVVTTTDESPTEAAPAPEATPVDLPAVLEQTPADTQVVVVNDAGQAEPLATTQAAEILVTGDPVWCPAGQVPTPGANGCTPGYGTMGALATELGTGSYTGAGTIWVESSYAGNDNSEITLNHSSMSGLTDLTVQGGWSGTSGDTTIGASSVFDVAFNIANWLGSVAVNNLTFTGAGDTYASLAVDTTGNITVDDITVTGNTAGTGASLDSCQYNGTTGLCAGTGNVTVTDSTFSGNNFIGLAVDSGGSTTLTNVTAVGNGLEGAFAIGQDDSAVTHDVTVNGGVFRDNDTGISVLSDGNVTLNNVDASGLYDAPTTTWSLRNNTGAFIDTTPGSGSVTVNGGQFNGNFWYGLDVYSAGNITVSNVDISDNSLPGHDTSGAYLDATYGDGVISVSNSTFNRNDGYGLFAIAHNNITLTNLTVDGGGITDVGAWIKAINGTATVDGGLSGIFTNTTKTGLIAIGGLQVDLVDLNVTANAGDGAQVYSTFTYACFGSTGIPVSVNGGTYTNNAGVPLTIKPGPDGTVVVSTAPAPSISGNGEGDEIVIDLGNPCIDKDEEKPEESKPVNIVEVPFKDGAPVLQDCTTYSGTALVLPDGTWVKFGCPFDGSVSLEGLLKEELPGPLGAGAEFVSAISYGMTGLDNAVVTVNPDGTITIKFKIPADSKARAYDILYWDPTANNGAGDWVILSQSKFGQPQAISLHPDDPEDGRLITRGVKHQDGYVTVTVNFTGIFVLVAR